MTSAVQALRARSRSLGVSGIGSAVLLGWWLGTLVLAAIVPSFASAASAAPPFLPTVLAIALLGDERPSRRRRIAVRVLGASIAAMGIVAIVLPIAEHQHLFGRASRELASAIARLDGAGLGGVAGPSFVLIGAALIAQDLDVPAHLRRLAEWLVGLPALAALVMLVDQLYEAPHLTHASEAYSGAINTSLGLVVACLAILASRPSRGVMRYVMSDGTAGRFLRRTLPAVIVIPIALGALRLAAERAGHYDGATAPALHTLAEVACLCAVVAWNARALFRSSERRRAAVERLRENEEDLRITLECIGDGVIATDAAGRVVRMSSAAERSTGFKRQDAIGKRLDTILRAVDRKTRAPLESPFDRVARTGSAAGLAETAILVSPDGTERALLQSGAPILSRLGILRGVVLVLGERRCP